MKNAARCGLPAGRIAGALFLLCAAAPRPAPAADAPVPAPVVLEKDAHGAESVSSAMFLETDIGERLKVTDPFLELHTGPGRGYPVFFVVQRGGWVAIQSRHTDWYRVLTEDGKLGWVQRAQLATTLTAAGSRKSFRDIMLEDYLQRRAELGAAWGHFSGSPMLKLWGAYKLNDSISLELTGGQVQGLYSGTSFWGLDVHIEPWSDRRLSPYFGIGVGRIENIPNASLVSAVNNNAKMADAGIGLRYHLNDRLIARVDWTEYTAFISTGRTDQYHALTAGLAFFF